MCNLSASVQTMLDCAHVHLLQGHCLFLPQTFPLTPLLIDATLATSGVILNVMSQHFVEDYSITVHDERAVRRKVCVI